MPTLGEISLFFNLFPPQKILFCTALVWFLKRLDENWLMITIRRCLALILTIMRLYVVGFCGFKIFFFLFFSIVHDFCRSYFMFVFLKPDIEKLECPATSASPHFTCRYITQGLYQRDYFFGMCV